MTQTASRLALAGGKPAVDRPQPSWPIISEEDVTRMVETVRSGRWSWMGPQENAFCSEFAAFIGSRYALGLANGTVTLQCALQAVGVVPGDEVIVPGLTWVATAQAAMDIGADVVLVDIDPLTMCIDPKAIEKAITPRTKAIIPVHLYGCMCDMDAIMEIARRHSLKVVEDVAHQHGSRWRDIGAGAIGDVGSFSFQQSKVLTSGEGGAITCNDESIYSTIHSLKQVGFAPDGKPGNRYGHNYRITEMQSVLLRGGLSRLPEQTALREERARYLSDEIRKLGGPLQPVARDERVTRQAFYALTLTYDAAKGQGVSRDQFHRAANAEGCGFGLPYPPVYASPLLNLYDTTSPIPFRDPERTQNYRDLKLPNVEKTVKETAILLSHQALLGDIDYMDQIVAAVGKVTENLPQVADYVRENPPA